MEDYGIYNVVGSVVAIFSSIQSLLASSTQRFLNFEHGRGNKDQLKKIFSMSVWIHVGISLLFLIIVLPIGLFLIKNYLTIPVNRLTAAYWVFIFSVLSAVVTILTVPYNAVIIANERMNIFAYISILDGVLRLGVIYLLVHLVFDQLITYAVLLFCVSFIIRVINMAYCHRNFNEAKEIAFLWDKKLFFEMSSFAGWQFLGNSGWAIQQQGLNMILNVFFGPLLNAARGIANQVNGGITLFVNNMMVAVNPQLVKLYASEEKEQMFELFVRSSKFSYLLICCLSLPVFLGTEYLLNLWLTTVPDYTVLFVRLVLVYSSIRVLHMPMDSLLKASGKIKVYQISDFIFLVLSLFITYLSYKNNANPEAMFFIMIVFQLFATGMALYLCVKYVNLSLIIYFRRVLVPCVSLVFLFLFILFIGLLLEVHVLLRMISLSLLFVVSSFFFVLTQKEKEILVAYLKRVKK